MRRKCSKKARPKVSLISFIAVLRVISYKFFCPLLHAHVQKVSIFFRAGYPIRRRNNIPCFAVGCGGMRGFTFLLLPPFLLIKY